MIHKPETIMKSTWNDKVTTSKRSFVQQKRRSHRPISTYNRFFHHERQQLVTQLEKGYGIDSIQQDTEGFRKYTKKDIGRTKKEKYSPFGSMQNKRKHHHQTYGKLGLADSTRFVAKRWKQLPYHEMTIYQDVFAMEKQRYRDETKSCQNFTNPFVIDEECDDDAEFCHDLCDGGDVQVSSPVSGTTDSNHLPHLDQQTNTTIKDPLMKLSHSSCMSGSQSVLQQSESFWSNISHTAGMSCHINTKDRNNEHNTITSPPMTKLQTNSSIGSISITEFVLSRSSSWMSTCHTNELSYSINAKDLNHEHNTIILPPMTQLQTNSSVDSTSITEYVLLSRSSSWMSTCHPNEPLEEDLSDTFSKPLSIPDASPYRRTITPPNLSSEPNFYLNDDSENEESEYHRLSNMTRKNVEMQSPNIPPSLVRQETDYEIIWHRQEQIFHDSSWHNNDEETSIISRQSNDTDKNEVARSLMAMTSHTTQQYPSINLDEDTLNDADCSSTYDSNDEDDRFYL